MRIQKASRLMMCRCRGKTSSFASSALNQGVRSAEKTPPPRPSSVSKRHVAHASKVHHRKHHHRRPQSSSAQTPTPTTTTTSSSLSIDSISNRHISSPDTSPSALLLNLDLDLSLSLSLNRKNRLPTPAPTRNHGPAHRSHRRGVCARAGGSH